MLVTVVDNNGRFAYVNKRLENMLGYDKEECIGMSAFSMVHPSDRPRTEASFRRWVREKQKNISFENRLVSKTGQTYELLWTISIHYDEHNAVRLISSFARDIGELCDTRRLLQHHLRFEKLIVDISLRFISQSQKDLNQVITSALKTIARFTGARIGFIYRLSPGRDKLSMSHYWSSLETGDAGTYFPDLEADMVKRWMNRLMERQEVNVFCVDDLPDNAKMEREICHTLGMSTLIEVPLSYGGSTEGFLGLAFDEKRHDWDRHDIALLHVAGSLFIGAIVQKLSEEALVKSRERYFSLYHAISEGLALHEYVFNKEGEVTDFRITEVNPQYEDNTGLKKSQVEGRLASHLFGHSPFLDKYAEVHRTGEPVTFISYFEPLKKYFRISAFSIGKGKFATAFSDITTEMENQKQLEQALNEISSLKEQLESDNLYLREEINLEHNFDEIISTSEAFLKILYHVEEVAKTGASVLIQGETGTGKELIARAIHSVSSRSKRPMVKLNCAAIPESLIESELFGHEKGAFTGAIERKAGRFELANGSTLFLDEVAELPLQLQPKLLRVLQDGEFERIGGVKTLKVDVRIVAATNREIEKEVEQGRFRQDLYYRLNVFPIHILPLRKRKEDIPVLVRYFTEKYSRKISKDITEIPSSIIKTFEQYDWPGNVRELENIIERSVILSRGNKLEIGNWFPEIIQREKQKRFPSLKEVEKNYIIDVLNNTNWKVSGKYGAAGILGLNPTTLEARMKKLGIHRRMNS